MPSISKMISDVHLRLNPKPSDDMSVNRKQIRFWLDSVAGSLTSDWIKKKNGGEVPAQIIQSFDCLIVQTEEEQCINGCNTKYYFELPKNPDSSVKSILSLPGDAGLVQVLQGTKQLIRVTNIAQVQLQMKLEFSNGFVYFSRVGDRVYLFNGVFPSYCHLSAHIASCDSTGMDESENYPTVDEVIPMILEEAEKIGTREIGKPKDLQDDGIG